MEITVLTQQGSCSGVVQIRYLQRSHGDSTVPHWRPGQSVEDRQTGELWGCQVDGWRTDDRERTVRKSVTSWCLCVVKVWLMHCKRWPNNDRAEERMNSCASRHVFALCRPIKY